MLLPDRTRRSEVLLYMEVAWKAAWKSTKKIVIIHDGLRLQIIDHVIGTGDLLLNLPLRFKQGNGPVALL